MYFTGTATAITPYAAEAENTRYGFNVSFVEVVRPIGNLQGALGWTFDELAGSYLSFDAVAAAYENFDDLALNEEL